MMKAAMYYGIKDVRIEDVPVPSPGEGEVRVAVAWQVARVGSAGPTCMNTLLDQYCVHGMEEPTPGQAKGSPFASDTFSGTVDALGKNLRSDWKLGDRVVVNPIISCGECYACKNEFENVCHRIGSLGLSGRGGGLSEYVCVKESNVHILPENISLKSGALVEPLSVAVHAVEVSGMKAGDTAMVFGAGPIGCLVIKTLLAQGASKVFCVEPSRSRRTLAEKLGAQHVFASAEVIVLLEAKRLTGGKDRGVDVSFDCAGDEASINLAIAVLRPKGTCVNVAVWRVQPKIDMNALLMEEKVLKSSSCYLNEHEPALDLLRSGSITLDDLITYTTDLAGAVTQGLDELVEHGEEHGKILVSISGAV